MPTIKQERKDLEMLLNGIVPTNDPISPAQQNPVQPVSNCVDSSTMPGFTPEKLFEFDYEATRKALRKRARKTLNNILRHILPDEMLNNPYVQDKMEQDIDTLADLYMQQEETNIMQRSLVENVSRGNTMPRNYEVFGQLSDKIQALNKQIMSTESTIRKTYLDLKLEIRDKENEIGTDRLIGAGKMQETDNGVIVSSSKQLIEMARKKHIAEVTAVKETLFEEE